MNTYPLQNKIAWVTGSSRGIGWVIADHLASLGAQVVIHGTTPYSTRAFHEADSLDDVAQAIAQKYERLVLPVTGDLSNDATVRAGVVRSIALSLHWRWVSMPRCWRLSSKVTSSHPAGPRQRLTKAAIRVCGNW